MALLGTRLSAKSVYGLLVIGGFLWCFGVVYSTVCV